MWLASLTRGSGKAMDNRLVISEAAGDDSFAEQASSARHLLVHPA